ADVSAYARRREDSLRDRLADRLRVHEEVVTAIAPGRITPTAKDHFAVFTPYFRRWAQTPIRTSLKAPRSIDLPRIAAGKLPKAADICAGEPSRTLPAGGETEGRKRLAAWLGGPIQSYPDRYDDLAGNGTSRLSPWLHFGCLSAAEIVHRSPDRQGDFVRQLAWRDFHHQVLAARPEAAHGDYRGHGDRWRRPRKEIDAWKSGRTGYPIVDAGMRQLLEEGWMHNRARLIVASFLTKTLYIDWRIGAAHFLELLVDGDIANNQLNWQWVAGTGTDTRPNRVLNPLRQAERFDPDGTYVRRYVPELAEIGGPAVHRPWNLPEEIRSTVDYPEPIVDLADGLARFRSGRG
ncbi:MAG TPA: deoxyribodipyrimidine photo-lyase, partial [Mycobacteriales bacterium]|nr:deoxyribodipyrimidine photo-lyase [Mycobacteriales bacterium]